MKAASVAVVALALLAGPLAYATHMSGYLQHNTAHTVYPYGTANDPDSGFPCYVTVQHGNVYGAAYAKIKANNINCSQLRVTVTALQNGKLVNASTGIINYPVMGRWYQATVNYANIVGSGFYTVDNYGRPVSWSYNGI